MQVIKLLVRSFRRLRLFFAAFIEANRPSACTLGFANPVESRISPKLLSAV